MRSVFAEAIFPKVDTGNNFCRNSFSKVDTIIQHLAKPSSARDGVFGMWQSIKSKVDTVQGYADMPVKPSCWLRRGFAAIVDVLQEIATNSGRKISAKRRNAVL